MLTKTFVLLQFGTPHAWMPQFIEHVQGLGARGWQWLIATPHDLGAHGNVRTVSMTAEQFAARCHQVTGVLPNMFVTQSGVPSVHVTDFCVANGELFADELQGSDYWGITNLDVVYGRLDRFIPDADLADHDVWTDDVGVINGVFTLCRNAPEVNALYRQIPDWQAKFGQPPCPRCCGAGGEHTLFGTDEYDLTEVIKTSPLRYGWPKPFPLHSYDRLEQHVPRPKLARGDDGSLWELFADTAPPAWQHAHSHFGREVMYFHFSTSKTWPL